MFEVLSISRHRTVIKFHRVASRICTTLNTAPLFLRFSQLVPNSFSFTRRPHIRRIAIVFYPMSGTSGPMELAGPAGDFLSERHVRDDDRGRAGAILYRRIDVDEVCIIVGYLASRCSIRQVANHGNTFVRGFVAKPEILLLRQHVQRGKVDTRAQDTVNLTGWGYFVQFFIFELFIICYGPVAFV